MDASGREALVHQAMDRFVHRVREWNASSAPYTSDRDVCLSHKDGIYRLFRDSGLQPWEFHTMLHRATEYGLVAPELRDLWAEVSTTFLQSFSEHSTDFSQPHAWGVPGSHFTKNSSMANGNGTAYSNHWLPANGRSSSAPARPPGLEPKQQGQHHSNGSSTLTSAAASARSVQDSDTAAGSASDQQNSRKQQQPNAGAKQAGRSAAVPGSSTAASNPAARGPGKQQQQQQQQLSAAGANGPSQVAGRNSSTTPDLSAAVDGKAGPDLLPNGFIPAWRYDSDTMQQQPGAAGAFAAAAAAQAAQKDDSEANQQQQKQQQSKQQGAGMALPAAAGSWEVQEPLDLLPSGLLDDVYDQSDVVVDGPSKAAPSTAMLNGAAAADGSNSSVAGNRPTATAAPGRSGGKQSQGKQQQQRQAKQPAAAAPAGEQQQQPNGPGRSQLPNAQQQQQPRAVSHDGSASVVPPPSPSSLLMGGGIFGHQQQQQQQPHGLNLGMNCLLPGMQARQSLDGNLQPPQQYNAAMQQQQHQARVFQQQQQFAPGLGPWGAGPAGYMGQPFLGMGPMQPPPPPRTQQAAAGSAAAAVPAGAAAPAWGPPAAASRPQSRVNYAAVAAAPPQTPGLPAFDAGANGVGSYGSSSSSSYKNPVGFSAAPGAPVHVTQQQQKAAAGATDGSGSIRTMQLYHPPGTAAPAIEHPSHQQHQQLTSSPPAQVAAAAPSADLRAASAAAAAVGGNSTEDAVVPPPVAPTLSNLSLFHTASLDSPVTPAVGGPMSPYPSPLQRSLSTSAGASPALQAMGLAAASGSSVGSSSGLAGMAPMLLPPAAVPAGLGAIGEPVGSFGSGNGSRLSQMMNGLQQQQQDGQAKAWSTFGPAVTPAPAVASDASGQQQQQQQQQQMPVGSVGADRAVTATPGNTDGGSSSAASSTTAATANSVVSTPHSKDQSAGDSAHALGPAAAAAAPADPAAIGMVQPPPPPPPPRTSSLDKTPQQQQGLPADATSGQQQSSDSPQPQPPPPPAKPMTWAQKLQLAAKANSSSSSSSAAGGAVAAAAAAGAPAQGGRGVPASNQAGGPSAGPRIAPAPLSETQQSAAARRSNGATTGQTLLAAAKQQEIDAEAAAAAAVPSYSEAAALDGLDAVTAKAAVTAASRMPLPAKMIQAWRSGLCLTSCIKLLQSQRPDLAMALNDRIKGWLCQDCDRSTAECLVLFVLTNLRRDWHVTAKSPGAFLMGLLQHRAALIGGSGMSRKLLEVARNFPNVAVYIDSDVLQELGDMDTSLRSFIMDEYMCKQRHDWPEGLKFPSQCLLSCMRSIRYADPSVHKAYINLMESRPDLGKAMNGVILYGLCKCDAGTGLAAVKRLSELPADWTSAARVNASAFLYQKVQELCGGHGY